jgi:hypothetical protein
MENCNGIKHGNSADSSVSRRRGIIYPGGKNVGARHDSQ